MFGSGSEALARTTPMPNRTFFYIDGESHYIRSEKAWQSLHGSYARLDCMKFVDEPDNRHILVNAEAKVFWTRRMHAGAKRATYFTSVAGDDQQEFQIGVILRDFGLEPFVIRERRQLATQRQNSLLQDCVIEKAKGVDIALAVRMVEDAARDHFDVCHLYTSDIDFLPVVEAVKARGKQVYVHGYRCGLARQSPFYVVPDQFTDLTEVLRTQYEPFQPR